MRIAFACLAFDATAQGAPDPSIALLATVKRVAGLPSLSESGRVIQESGLPFVERVERRGVDATVHEFEFYDAGEVRYGVYWYRERGPRRQVYFRLALYWNKVCIERAAVEAAFGNTWLSGFRNDMFPGAKPIARTPDEPHFGLMAYQLSGDVLVSLSFNNPRCVSAITIAQGDLR